MGAAARGLSRAEAARRLQQHGPNELVRRGGPAWPRELLAQLVHPLALLLFAAAALAFAGSLPSLAVAVLGVIAVNAIVAFVQERHAEEAVEALGRYLPAQARVLRDGEELQVDARTVVPGDLLLVEEGERISADARLIEGAVEVDLSALTGESVAVERSATHAPPDTPPLEAEDRIFSGTTCTAGDARGRVVATGMATELGRIAALSQRTHKDDSPLQIEVRRVAWLIALIAVVAGVAFVPIGMVAGLPFHQALLFAIGLLVANVPEGLLPTITLALADGVRRLTRGGALVKRLSAVETLGATTVICTDKTGTLTQNRMHVHSIRPVGGEPELLRAAVACTTAVLHDDGGATGDPTEVALLLAARERGIAVDEEARHDARVATFHFDPRRKLMTTVDAGSEGMVAHVKGAPDVLLERCALTARDAVALREEVDEYARRGLRVLAIGRRPVAEPVPEDRDAVERDLELLGLVTMFDPLRPAVAGAVARCHTAGVRVIVISGDHGLTVAAIARDAGIGGEHPSVIEGRAVDAMSDAQLGEVLAGEREPVFARASPETKLRIAEVLREQGHVVAMTGDGVNDAPALRRADIGIAMGESGTDVAREAATMVLTDDDFTSIVTAVEEGRRVYSNIRKFILYIFAHAPAEVVPFLAFALSGGAIPLPLTVMQILAIDLGTETLPAIALGRERAERGAMERPPRPRSERLIGGELLVRAWLVLGAVSAVLVLAAVFFVLLRAGWTPGEHVSGAVHDRATTTVFLAIVVCQVGTAFAARCDDVSLRSIGWRSNPWLLGGIVFELVFAAVLTWVPALHPVFGTAPVRWDALAFIAPFPLIVWGVDELRRHSRRAAGKPARPERRSTDDVTPVQPYRRDMTMRSVRVGRLAGIPIGIQPLWLAIVGLITWSLGHDYFPSEIDGISAPAAYGLGLAGALLLFASILAHELGHAIVARGRGVEIEEIDLWLLGGVARMKQEPQRGIDELAFAAAGPAVTAVIAALLTGLRFALPARADAALALVDYELYVNAAVLVFNLLPAFPLDGGRILRAVMWMRSGDHQRATVRAAGIGRAFGMGMIFVGLLAVLNGVISGFWLALVGMFVLAAAGAESQHASLRERFGDAPVDELLSSPVICIPGELTVAEAIPAYFVRHRHPAYPVLDATGRVAGLLTAAAVRTLPTHVRDSTPVAAIADVDPALLLHPGDAIAEVLERPAFIRQGHAVAVDADRRPIGMFAAVDVRRWVEATELLPPLTRAH